MLNNIRQVKIIGYVLTIFYGISFLYYWVNFTGSEHYRFAVVLSVLFFGLFVSAIAVTQLKEWGRKLLIILSGVMVVYFLALAGSAVRLVHPGYILLTVVVVLYFNQLKVKLLTRPEWKFNRKSILVVDDDEGLIKMIQKILLPKGYSVLAAQTGEKGMQVAKLQKPDLIILDVILPGIKGRDVCLRLKEDEETKNIPVIFLTAKDSPDDIKAELAAGGLTHLTKPVHARTLIAEIKKVLG